MEGRGGREVSSSNQLIRGSSLGMIWKQWTHSGPDSNPNSTESLKLVGIMRSRIIARLIANQSL